MVATVRTGVGLSLCRASIALHEQQAHGRAIAEEMRISTELSVRCLKARIGDPSIWLLLMQTDALGSSRRGSLYPLPPFCL